MRLRVESESPAGGGWVRRMATEISARAENAEAAGARCGHGPVMLDLTVRLSEMARECESLQLVARAWSSYASELRRELDMIDSRSYIVRTRTQDLRDTWLDRVDLRRKEQAALVLERANGRRGAA
jgi:hypothetical protein